MIPSDGNPGRNAYALAAGVTAPMAETQWKAAQDRWASTTTALSRMPLWRLAMAIGVLLAVAAAVAELLQPTNPQGRGGGDTTVVVYNLVLAGIGFVGLAVSGKTLLNGAIVAAVSGIGLVLVGGGTLALLAGVALLIGAVWAFATTRQPAPPRPYYPPPP